MKKLLSLLSVLTISGTAVPTTIAASPYQKEEQLNIDINFLKTNNLENLNRNKRQNNNQNITGVTESVVKTNGNIVSSGVVLNNNVYFGCYDGKVYEYNPITRESKIVITTNGLIYSSGVVLNNKLYIGSNNGNIYEYNPATEESKIVITSNKPIVCSGVVLNNKLYFGSDDGKVYEYNPVTEESNVVITTKGIIESSGIVLNNKVYFGSNDYNVYEYNPATEESNVVIKTNGIVQFSGVVLNNKLYFGSDDDNLYEYEQSTNQQKIVVHTNGSLVSSGVVLNNKLYFGSDDYNIYEYEPLKLIESDIINMRNQIKKGLYLYYYNMMQNNNSEIKPISNINLDKLVVYTNLVIEEKQENKSSNLQQTIDNFCPNFNSTFINNSSIEQTQNTASCSKELKEIKTFQKTNGFSKSKTTSNDKNWNANISSNVVAKSAIKAGIPFVVEGKIEVEVGGGYTWGSSQSYAIEDNSNSSDTEIKTTENNINITIPSQPVKISAKSKISIYATSWKNNIELILSYYQKVEGMVSADFIDQNNNKKTIYISIKDAMLNLAKNNILPSKIKINDDNSINFYYNIKSLKQIIMHQTEIGEAIPLNSYEQNVTFKDNTTDVLVVKN